MKLLDPFAGYRLASGHPVFHLAFFAGSWTVNYFEDAENFLSRGPIVEVFYILRWVHCTVFLIAIVSGWADKPSDLPDSMDAFEDAEEE